MSTGRAHAVLSQTAVDTGACNVLTCKRRRRVERGGRGVRGEARRWRMTSGGAVCGGGGGP
eukprot:5094990-Pleurochrysis_carterae.AAC.1